ncbi:Thermoresistant gluconokinase [Thalassocella blandensis]|nr:Thermoresistant gluconokinase [Thalassocella blandensis]
MKNDKVTVVTRGVKNNALTCVVMGVSGSGKTTLAKLLAKQLHLPMFDADDFHSEKNKLHMAQGRPLSDEMRLPWVKRLVELITDEMATGRGCVLAYSGLRKEHRQLIRLGSPNVVFIFLNGSQELIAKRLAGRDNHFMPASLLQSQFNDLDIPVNEHDVIVLDVEDSLENLLTKALAALKQAGFY